MSEYERGTQINKRRLSKAIKSDHEQDKAEEGLMDIMDKEPCFEPKHTRNKEICITCQRPTPWFPEWIGKMEAVNAELEIANKDLALVAESTAAADLAQENEHLKAELEAEKKRTDQAKKQAEIYRKETHRWSEAEKKDSLERDELAAGYAGLREALSAFNPSEESENGLQFAFGLRKKALDLPKPAHLSTLTAKIEARVWRAAAKDHMDAIVEAHKDCRTCLLHRDFADSFEVEARKAEEKAKAAEGKAKGTEG